MKRVLILGATGGIGYALVRELVDRDLEVIAFARTKERLIDLYEHEQNVTILVGDVLRKEDVIRAAKGVNVIFHAVSFPYQEWREKHLLSIDNILMAAKVQGSKIALVDNVYAYGRQSKREVVEEAEKNPHTKKGKIRLEMEKKLQSSEVPCLIVHLPDLYGPNAENTLLYETLKSAVLNKKANYVGDLSIAREFIFTFDAAKAMAELALREDTYNENWNIPSVHPITGEEIAEILQHELGYSKSIRPVSKRMIRFLGLFQPFMREMVEMMYLTEEPVILRGKKYESRIGNIPQTSYQEGIKQTLQWMNQKNPR